MSTLSPFMLHSATDSDADVASGDSVSLARSISKDSLASNVTNVTPKHQTAVHQHSLAAMRRVNGHNLLNNINAEDEEETLVAVSRTDGSVIPKQTDGSTLPKPSTDSKPAADGFYLEPLMPAVLRTAKEKSVCLNKEEESGEVSRSTGRGALCRGNGSSAAVRRKAPPALNRTFTAPGEEEVSSEEQQAGFRPTVTSSVDSSREPAEGFYLHSDSEEPKGGPDLDAELEDLDEEEEDLDEALTTKSSNFLGKMYADVDDKESAKLQEDMNVKEHEDKDLNGGSGRSSPCLSTHSQASSMASGSVRMTSFAERKAQQQRFGSNHDLRSSASSSQRTTPDGSESSGPLSSSWRLKRDQSPSSPLGGCTRLGDGTNVLASEIVQLRMQLEEKRRAIEHQKKKMEVLSARQRQKLGKAAFLHIVKKGGGRSDTLPNSLKSDISKDELNGEKGHLSKDDLCVDALRGEKAVEGTVPPGALEADKKGNSGSFYLEEELDLNECSRSIELLNEAIGSIQQQMMQLSLQQEVLMKQNVQSPPGAAPPPHTGDKNGDSKTGAGFHFMEHVSGSGSAPTRKPPKLSSGRSSRSKPAELRMAKDQSRQASRTLTPTQTASETLANTRQLAGGRSPRAEQPDSPRIPTAGETVDRLRSSHVRSTVFHLHDEANMRLPTRVDLATVATPEVSFESPSSKTRDPELNSSDASGKENFSFEEAQQSKAHLIEVDLSDLKAPEDEEGAEDTMTEGGDGEQKSVMGFFFKVLTSHYQNL